MEGLPSALIELLTQLVDTHGEEAVHRALSLVPMLSLVRDDAAYHLNAAAGAADHDGPSGALVLGVPRKRNQPTEINWLGGKIELKVVV